MKNFFTQKRLWIPLSLTVLGGIFLWITPSGPEEQREVESPLASSPAGEKRLAEAGDRAPVADIPASDPAGDSGAGFPGERRTLSADFGLQDGEVVTGTFLRRQAQRKALPLVEIREDLESVRRLDDLRAGADLLQVGWSEPNEEGYQRRVTILEFPGDHLGPIRLEEMVSHPMAGMEERGTAEGSPGGPYPEILVMREDSAQYLTVQVEGEDGARTLEKLQRVLSAEYDRMISPVGLHRLRLKDITLDGVPEAVEASRGIAETHGGVRLVEEDSLKRVADEAGKTPVYPYPEEVVGTVFVMSPEERAKHWPPHFPRHPEAMQGTHEAGPGWGETETNEGGNFRDSALLEGGLMEEMEMDVEPLGEETLPPGMGSKFYDEVYAQMVQMHAPEAWTVRNSAVRDSGETIVVGVLDTGVSLSHPDMVGNLWVNPNPGINAMGIQDDIHGVDLIKRTGNPDDIQTTHGTHVAGTVGADGTNGEGIAGVAWEVDIMALRFLGPNGGWGSDAIAGLDYMIEMGAHVGNHSWGGSTYMESLKEAFDRQTSNDIISSVAAGNHHQNTHHAPLYPSFYSVNNKGIVTVMSATKRETSLPGTNTPTGGKDFFSSYGTATQIGAHGVNIYSLNSLWEEDGNLYRRMSGTSMAAPHVAGAMALLRAEFPDLDVIGIRERILKTSDWSNDLAGFNLVSGMINLYRALTEDPDEHLTVAMHIRPNPMDELSTGGFGVPSSGPLEGLTRGHYLAGSTFPVGVTIYGFTDYGEWEEGDLEVELVASMEVVPISPGEEVPEIEDKVITLSPPTEIDRFLLNSGFELPGYTGSLVFVTLTLTVSGEGYDTVVRELVVSSETAPENDAYSTAIYIPIEGGSYTTNNRYAWTDFNWGDGPHDYEAFGDPLFIAGYRSYKQLWWKWTPKYDTVAEVNTYGSEHLPDAMPQDMTWWTEEYGYDTLLAVMTGTWPKETLYTVGANRLNDQWPDVPGVKRNWSRVVFEAKAGVEYTFVVGGHYSYPGGVNLNLIPNYPAPVVKEEPPVQVTGILGRPIDISATVLWAETYEWRREGMIGLPDGPQPDGATLSFESLEMGHAGTYTLHAFNPYGETATREVHLRVIDPAGIGDWATFNPWPTPHGLGGLARGPEDEQIAVGGSGTLLRQTEDSEWTAVPLGIAQSLSDIVYDAGRDRYVVVGDEGIILTGDGLAWETHQIDGQPRLRSLALGDGDFVAVGGVLDAGVILYSENGDDWTDVTPSGLTDVLYDVAWNGSVFVAVGGDPATGQGALWQSGDGQTWQVQASGQEALLYGLDWWQDAWTVVGGNDAGAVLYRGSNAAALSPVSVDSPEPLYAVGSNDEWQAAVGEMGRMAISTDGNTWQWVESGTPYALKAVYGAEGSMEVAGDVGVILHSENGEDWSGGWGHRQTMETVATIPQKNRLTAVGDSSTALVSAEGSDWNVWSIGEEANRYFALYFDADAEELIAVGEFGSVATSREHFATTPTLDGGEEVVQTAIYGQEWEEQVSNQTLHLRGVTGNGQDYIAVGSRGLIVRSEGRNGIWSKMSSPTSQRLNDVLWTGEEYLAVGNQGTLLRSVTGQNWQPLAAPVGEDLFAIAPFAGRYYITADAGKILHSADLQNWSVVDLETEDGLFGLASGGGQLVAVGERGALFSSADGKNWDAHFSGVRTSLYGAVYQDERFIVVGSMGTVLSANPLPTVEPVVLDPEEDIHPETITASLSTATEGASIYYTLDGTRPDENATLYTNPFEVEEPTLVRARAFAEDHEPSGITDRQLIIGDAPFITVHPVSHAAALGGSTTFSVEVMGEEPFTYQWYRGETELEEATSRTLPLDNLSEADAGTYRVAVSNTFGSVESEEAELTLMEAPSILSQPEDQYAYFGQTLTLELAVSGGGPFTYEWQKDDETIHQGSQAQLTIPSVSSFDVGRYRVIVRNAVGTAVSDPFMLYVNDEPEAPSIVGQPVDAEGLSGEPVHLEVAATGSLPMEYTWYHDGEVVSSSTSPVLTLAASAETVGTYWVKVENAYGEEMSETAQLGLIEEGSLLDLVLVNPGRSEVAIPEGMGLVLSAEITEYGENTGALGLRWEKVEGPGEVHFGDPMHTQTTARFASEGKYQLRLHAWNALAEDFLDVEVLVVETSALDTGLTGYPGNELYLPLENYFLTGVVGETEVSDGSLKLSNTEGLGQQGVVLNFTKGDFRLDQVGDKIRASFNWRQNRSTSTSRLANSFAWGFFSGSEADQNHWDQHHDWAGFFHHIPSTMGSQSTASYSFGMQIPNLDLFHSASYTTSNFFSKSGLPPQANQTFPVVLTIERVRLEGEEYVEMTSRFPVSHSSAINLSGVETTREVIWSLHKPSGAGEILTVKSAYPLEYAMTEFSGIGFSNREHNTIEGFEISDLLIEPVRGGLTFENIGPLVEFTADEVSIPVDQSYELVAQVQDDGLPRVPGSVSSLWQQISGETLTLPQPHALETDIHPETVGMRTFRLYADDGEITTFAEKRVGVSTDGEHLPPEFLTEALPDGVEGSAYEALLETSGGAGSLTLSLEDGPAWLNLSDAGDGTALLNGTPSEAGDVSLVVSVSDGIDTVSQTFTLAVLPDGSVPGLPVLSLGEPADIGISSAKLAANLEAGATPVYLELYVGLVDEGENAGAWDQHLTIGYRNHGTYVKEAPGLEPGTLYFYRFVATNEVGTRWSETGEFVTSGGPVGMSYTIRFPGYPGEGPVQEYPLLVRLAEGLGGFSYAELAYPESGADLRFYDEALNELPFEIEQWNEDGESTVWVQVPELDAATKLTMVVGDPSRDALPAYAMDGSIWETHFDSVWHLGEAAGEPRADATPQGADVVSTGSSPVAQVPGIVGYAAGFDGSGGNSRLETTGAELLPVHQLTNRFSLEGWIYIDPSVNNHDDNRYWRLLSQDSQWSNGAGYSSSLLSANRFDFSIGVSPGLGSGNGRKRLMSEMDGVFPEVPYGEWIYLSTTWDGNILRQYINGVKVGEDLGFNHSIAYAENPSPLRLGANEDRSLAGRLDEVRFSHEPKSADWVRTTYVNIAETEYFLTIEPRMTGGDRPAFLTRAEPQAIVGEEYDEEIKLYAKDADSLSLDAEGLPAWLTLEGTDNPRTYVLRGTPSVDDLGSSAITLTATNDAGEAEQNFVLWVYPEGTLAGLPDFGPLQVLERGVYEATLGADLQVGDEPVEVWLWYGRENGGDQPESWEHRYRFPEQKVGMFAHQVENLEEETLYYFRFFAENEVGSVQTESLAFSTRRDLTEIYPVAHLENPGVSNVRIPSGVGLVLEAEVEEAGGVSDSLVYLWESLSGPATVAWEASDSRETVAWFPENGSYVLRFTADNSVNADSFEVEVEVVDPALIDGNSGPNIGPMVQAGEARTVDLGRQVALEGSYQDDGLPNPPASVSLYWRQADGPETVGIAEPGVLEPKLIFPELGDYTFRLQASDGEIETAHEVLITVEEGAPFAPEILEQPQSISLVEGSPASFFVLAQGNPLPTYQWSKDGSDLAGETEPELLIPAPGFSDEGVYQVAVSNSEGTVNSEIVELTLAPLAPHNLTAEAVSPSRIDLAWSYSGTVANAFRLEHAPSASGPWTELAVLSSGIRSYEDHSLTQSETRYYRLFAIREDVIDSDASATAQATTPATGLIQMSEATRTVPDTQGLATIYVERIGGDFGAVSASYATSDGNAVSGQDYHGVSGVVHWEDGDTAPKAIQVPVLYREEDPGDRSFALTLSDPVGAIPLGSPASTTVTIEDAELPEAATVSYYFDSWENDPDGQANGIGTLTHTSATALTEAGLAASTAIDLSATGYDNWAVHIHRTHWWGGGMDASYESAFPRVQSDEDEYDHRDPGPGEGQKQEHISFTVTNEADVPQVISGWDFKVGMTVNYENSFKFYADILVEDEPVWNSGVALIGTRGGPVGEVDDEERWPYHEASYEGLALTLLPGETGVFRFYYSHNNATAAGLFLGQFDAHFGGEPIDPAQPPEIVSQPESLTVDRLDAASFSVSASGEGDLAYQWFKDGEVVSGATSATYTAEAVEVEDAGSYRVMVSNSSGSVLSDGAMLTVVDNRTMPEIASWPEATDIIFGESLNASTLNGGSASVAGEFVFVDPGLVPSHGTRSYAVTFVPDDLNAYFQVDGQVSVKVNLVTPEIALLSPANLLHNAVDLRADLLAGDASLEVTLWYGKSDGGFQEANWDQVISLGAQELGSLTVPVTGLDEQTVYHYRFVANNLEESVQTATDSFTTPQNLTGIEPEITLLRPTVENVRIPQGMGLVLETEVVETGGTSGQLSLLWETVSGDGEVTWDHTDQAETAAWFDELGDYHLRFTANNGSSTDVLDFMVEVVHPSELLSNERMAQPQGSSATTIAIQGSNDFQTEGDFTVVDHSTGGPIPTTTVTDANGLSLSFLGSEESDTPVTLHNNWNDGGFYVAGAEYNLRSERAAASGQDALDEGAFVEFKIETDGSTLADFDLTSIEVDLWRNGGGAPDKYQFALNDGSGDWTLVGSEFEVDAGLSGSATLILEDIPLSGVTEAYVRLYYWGNTNISSNTHYYGVRAEVNGEGGGTSLPLGWSSITFGNPDQAGEEQWDEDALEISGSDGDFWNGDDGGHFVYTTVSGEVDIRANLSSFATASGGSVNQYAKAAVMVRHSLDDQSYYGFMGVQQDTLRRQVRSSFSSNPSTQSAGTLSEYPWFRITRTGNEMRFYRSTDGDNWNEIGSAVTLPMSEEVQVGLAVSSHGSSGGGDQTAIARFDTVWLNGETVEPVVGGGGGTGNIGPYLVASGTPEMLDEEGEVHLQIDNMVDDGLPENPGEVILEWAQMSGPAAVDLGPNPLDMFLELDQVGEYVFRATAFDGEIKTAAPYIVITVEEDEAELTLFEQWLQHYGRSHLNPDTNTVRKGGRMVTLREAFLLGDDPEDPNDVLRIYHMERHHAEDTMELHFRGYAGREYHVQVSTDLESWTDLGWNEDSWVLLSEGGAPVSGRGSYGNPETEVVYAPLHLTGEGEGRLFYRVISRKSD